MKRLKRINRRGRPERGEGSEISKSPPSRSQIPATPSVSPPTQPPVFRADHPFLFVIRHKQTGSILFTGRVTNPKT